LLPKDNYDELRDKWPFVPIIRLCSVGGTITVIGDKARLPHTTITV